MIKKDLLVNAEYKRNDLEVLETTTAYQGFFRMLRYRVRHRLFSGGWSGEIKRELCHRGEASAAVLYDPEYDLVGLIEQFRIGAIDSEHGPWCLEVVAGMVEGDESPDALIRREIFEEAGISDVRLRPISSYYSTPGGCSEKIHLYCGLCHLKGAAGIFGLDHEGEDIRLHVLPSSQVFDGMLRGRTNNAATLIGLQWLQLNLQSLRETDAQ